MSVSSPHPPARQVGVHRLEILASDGTQSLTASAELTQTGPDRRRPVSRWLVVIGALLVLVGALVIPWFRDATPLLDLFEWIRGLPFVQLSMSMDPFMVMFAAEPPLRILLVVLAFAMAFGMTGKSGGLTRKSAILVVLLTVDSSSPSRSPPSCPPCGTGFRSSGSAPCSATSGESSPDLASEAVGFDVDADHPCDDRAMKQRERRQARTRYVVMGVVGAVVAAIVVVVGQYGIAAAAGWSAACIVYLIWIWATIGHMDAPTTKAHAYREDPTRTMSEVLLVLASLASLVVTVFVLVLTSAREARRATSSAVSPS